MKFIIKTIETNKEIEKLKSFILKQKQFYPNFDEWVLEKCIPRIELSVYKTYLAIDDNKVIGNLIFNINKDIEIKNFRIDENYRNRDLGHFLINQLYLLNKDLKLDVTVDNFKAVQFFIRNGFNIIEKKELYLKNQFEYLMEKTK